VSTVIVAALLALAVDGAATRITPVPVAKAHTQVGTSDCF
jgi:hypothetical protein